MQETWIWSLGWEGLLEKGMTAHSSILACRIQWTKSLVGYSPWNSPSQNTGGGSCSLLQGIFPTQGLNLGLPHCWKILYQLSHQGSPRTLEWVANPFSSGSSQHRNLTGVSCITGGFFTSWATKEGQGKTIEVWNNEKGTNLNPLRTTKDDFISVFHIHKMEHRNCFCYFMELFSSCK